MLEELKDIIRMRQGGEIPPNEANRLKYNLAKRYNTEEYIKIEDTADESYSDDCDT